MTPCGIKWCVAVTDTQFCVVHTRHRDLRPQEIDVDVEDMLIEANQAGYDEGHAEVYEEAKAEYEDTND